MNGRGEWLFKMIYIFFPKPFLIMEESPELHPSWDLLSKSLNIDIKLVQFWHSSWPGYEAKQKLQLWKYIPVILPLSRYSVVSYEYSKQRHSEETMNTTYKWCAIDDTLKVFVINSYLLMYFVSYLSWYKTGTFFHIESSYHAGGVVRMKVRDLLDDALWHSLFLYIL